MPMMNDAIPNPNKKMWKVLAPIKYTKDGSEKTYWMRLGVAYTNRDGSINLHLDAMPLKDIGKMQLRDFDEPDRREGRDGGDGHRNSYAGGGGGGGGAMANDGAYGAGAFTAEAAIAASLAAGNSVTGDVPF